MEPLKQSIKLCNLWFHLEDLLPSDTTYVKIVSAGARELTSALLASRRVFRLQGPLTGSLEPAKLLVNLKPWSRGWPRPGSVIGLRLMPARNAAGEISMHPKVS